ncbi:hypothetical protein A0256_05495 [Mucilaginibacter sp. PAMC 26640]|nr:hypothetical protein A0256_05495 [Mucilaginibacter sp. PAMC 26640]
MSSHHIVREKQEPALLLLNIDGFDDELLGQLLEWSPTVITTPITAEQISAFGIKVDFIITNELNQGLQSDIKLIPTGVISATNAAMHHLINAGYTSVNVVTAEIILDELLAYADKINLVIFCKDQKIFPVKSGFSKWKPAGEDIFLLSSATNLITEGLAVNSNARFLTQHDGFYTLWFDEPFVFIAEFI